MVSPKLGTCTPIHLPHSITVSINAILQGLKKRDGEIKIEVWEPLVVAFLIVV
eukprot:GDKH01011660.1.p1 GENE.GDKH01011660.1~~GDKH01011660.1.p1  ORF type:complete len:53 (+),score=1.68 GDKH01011660.1:50-208(+)